MANLNAKLKTMTTAKTDSAKTDTSDAQSLMRRVLDLAARGSTTTFPNPRVGCVLVNNGEIVGEGYHSIAGGLHAEREALTQAGEAARGATAYINLEPCCHQGRTPPCTDGLIDAGVSKVVAAMHDPNPLVAGGGFEVLKMAGVEVESGLMKEQAAWLNRGFIKRMRSQRPWVTLKSAATLDGRTAAYDGQSKWITGDAARHQVQQLRSHCSAIVTGIETILIDDPRMDVRLDGTAVQPIKVVLDSELRIPLDSHIITSGGQLLVFTLSNDLSKIGALIELGVEVIQYDDADESASGEDGIDLNKVLEELARWQCNEVLVEAGQTLSGAFLQAGLVDELVLFYAGSLLGDQAKSMFSFNEPLPFTNKIEFRIDSVEMIGPDIKVSAINQASQDSLLISA